MNNNAARVYGELAGTKEDVNFRYSTKTSNDNYATDLLHKLEDNAHLDCERGFTSHGPHRDDLQINLGGHLALEIASRGEMRTLLLVCKILEATLLERAREIKPILLFDDVFSELDGHRRQALTKFLQPYQTFITTTDADVVIQHFTESANIIPINNIQA
jgi:DNA replication and repair protein RecF